MKIPKKALLSLLKIPMRYDGGSRGCDSVYIDFKKGVIQVCNDQMMIRVITKGDDSDVKGFFTTESIKSLAKSSSEITPDLIEDAQLKDAQKASEWIQTCEKFMSQEYTGNPTNLWILPKHLVLLADILDEFPKFDSVNAFYPSGHARAKFVAKSNDFEVTAILVANTECTLSKPYKYVVKHNVVLAE